MNGRRPATPVAIAPSVGGTSHASGVFAPPRSRDTLGVDYLYESAGRKRGEGGKLTVRWRFAVQ